MEGEVPQPPNAIPPEANLIAADWEGAAGWRVVPENGEEYFLSREEMLAGDAWRNAPRPCVMVVEFAHLHERRPLSVAQVYTQKELEALHQRAIEGDVEIRVFPQRLSMRARYEGGFVDDEGTDDKEKDPQAILAFVRRWPEVTLKRWKPYTEEDHLIHDVLSEIRFDGTVRLNQMRPDYNDHPEVERVREFLPDVCGRLSEGAQEQFGLYLRRDGRGVRRTGIKWAQIMALYVAAYNDDGTLRLNPKGDFIGIEFIWSRVLMMSPYHGSSGTARSNLMYHGLRNYAKPEPYRSPWTETREEHYERREKWREWRRQAKEMLRALRDVGIGLPAEPQHRLPLQ